MHLAWEACHLVLLIVPWHTPESSLSHRLRRVCRAKCMLNAAIAETVNFPVALAAETVDARLSDRVWSPSAADNLSKMTIELPRTFPPHRLGTTWTPTTELGIRPGSQHND